MEDRLFEVDDVVEFDYVEEQRLNSSLCIRNLTDQVINFNVRINFPKLYPVVKPSGGIIYGGDQHKITISRLPLSREEFNVASESPNIALKDLFQVTCTLEYTDGLGKVRSRDQSKNIPVRLRRRSSIIAAADSQPAEKQAIRDSSIRTPQPPNPQYQQLTKLVNLNASLAKQIRSLQIRIDLLRELPQTVATNFTGSEIALLAVFCCLLALCFLV